MAIFRLKTLSKAEQSGDKTESSKEIDNFKIRSYKDNQNFFPKSMN